MPIYDYICECGAFYMITCSIADKPTTVECAQCSKPMQQVLMSPPGFILKGSGWTPKGGSS
jgi:putative FmdB family regulatory protein